MNVLDLVRKLARNERLTKVVLIASIVLPIILVLPHARSLVVRNAITTAYLSSLNAPIEGIIESIDVAPGSESGSGLVAATIYNSQADRSRVSRLEVIAIEAEVDVRRVQAQVDSVRGTLEARQAELVSYVRAMDQELGKRLNALNERAKALDAALTEARSNLARTQSLHDEGLLSASDLESAEASFHEAQANQADNSLERSRILQQLGEIQEGVFQIDIPEGVLGTRQSLEALEFKSIELEQMLGEKVAQARAAKAEYQAAKEALEQKVETEVRLPAGKTVWNIHAAEGSWIDKGGLLLTYVDCARMMLDIAVDDATLELIEPGMTVEFRLFGSFDYLTARVALIRGSAALFRESELVAEIEERGFRKGQVLATLETSEMTEQGFESCEIGRTAYAEFEGISMLEMIFYPLFR